MTERIIATPGGNVWTNRVGNGPEVPLLVLHGGPGMPSPYLNPLGELGDHRPVIFYDQLGCGRSDRPSAAEGRFVKEHFIAEIDHVRNGLGLTMVHLLGHSWGGLLAALYMQGRPEGVRSITFASPLIVVSRWIAGCITLKAQLPHKIADIIDRHEASGNTGCPEYAAANFEWWNRYVCTVSPFPEDLENALSGEGKEVYETMWGPSEFSCTGNLNGIDASAVLRELSCPSLFTCGRNDEAIPETIESFAKLVRKSEFRVFEHSAHLAHLEESEAYLTCLRDFLLRADQAG